MMNQAAMFSLFGGTADIPFSARREAMGEKIHLLRKIGLAIPSKFRPPPLATVFGPGTPLPKGPAVPKPLRKSKKR